VNPAWLADVPSSVDCSANCVNNGRHVAHDNRFAHMMLLQFEPCLECFEHWDGEMKQD
jgi:hypothetical protein